ncbi:MAG TPA: alpha/beta fold hydrolase [Candidatus Hydrogenedentes bacterium]|nr:alpha/beta fold hydrolase [Candidatus Hydrogenedentota bacterium]
MPVFEMPLEQLELYAGRNPRPADFDAYWDRAKEEMRALESGIELIPADFQTSFAECFHLYFQGVGGARVHAKYLRPRKRGEEKHPAVLHFHGYTGSSGDWHDKLGYVAQGFSVAALDVRGQGGLSEDPGGVRGNTHTGQIIRGLDDSPDKLFFRQVFLDTAQLAALVFNMPEVDPDRVCAMGMSQGGGLTLACAALEPRIRRLAPMCPFLCDYQRVWEMDLAVNSYAELKTFFRLFDPNHQREREIFSRLGYIDCQHLAERIQGETLMAIGLMDQICPPSSQFAAYNKLKSQRTRVLYHDFAHETYPGFHDKVFQFFSELCTDE